MQLQTIKLAEITKPEKNIRIHTEQQLLEYERSVKMFGQIRPIVLDENMCILAGNGLYDTLVRMKKDTADVYIMENLTENQKKKLMIADNKIFNLGIENLDTFNDFLNELKGDLDVPGFNEDLLKQMVADADEITERISEYGVLNEAEIAGIKDSGERKKRKIETSINEDPSFEDPDSNQDQEPDASAAPPASTDRKPPAEGSNFVICPGCGGTIWL